jgi:hypothetical protein
LKDLYLPIAAVPTSAGLAVPHARLRGQVLPRMSCVEQLLIERACLLPQRALQPLFDADLVGT